MRAKRTVRELTSQNKQLLQQIEQLRKELREAKDIQQSLEEAGSGESCMADLNKSLKEFEFFVASITHDLKSPAATVRGLARHLYKKYENPSGEKALIVNQIANASGLMELLIERINTYMLTRMDDFKFEELETREVIDNVREEFYPKLQGRGIQFLTPTPNRSIRFRGSEPKILSGLHNLVDNAFKYGGEGQSRIEINCKEDNEYVTFSVYNDGSPVRKEDCEKIFEIFQRDEKISSKIAGSGLGLAIVKKVAERHGGNAWAEPDLKKGVRFFISISKFL